MSEIETRHYLANRQRALTPAAKEAIAWAGQTQAQMVDLKFCDLLGTWRHMTLPISAFDGVVLRRREPASTVPRSGAGRGSPSRTCF